MLNKKVKLPRKLKKKFINARHMGDLKYWIQKEEIIKGKRDKFDKIVYGHRALTKKQLRKMKLKYPDLFKYDYLDDIWDM